MAVSDICIDTIIRVSYNILVQLDIERSESNIVMDTIPDIDLSSYPKSKYLALSDAIQRAISTGKLTPGERLPTVRSFAQKVGVTPGTVARAYQRLTESGQLEARVGSGTFVSQLTETSLAGMPAHELHADPDVIDLRSPTLPDVGQVGLIRDAMIETAAHVGATFHDYPSRTSDRGARVAVAKMLSTFPIGEVDPEHIVLTHGGQHAINLILQTNFSGTRPVMITEDLSYAGFRHAARLCRAEVQGIDMDEEGPIPASIDAICRKHQVQLMATSPSAQNPTTIRTSAARRAAIVALARKYDFQIIEDECYALLPNTEISYRSLAPERTWFVASISKSFCASIRFGYFIAPEAHLVQALISARHNFFGVSQPVSEIAQKVLAEPNNLKIREAVYAKITTRLEILAETLGHALQWQPGLPFAFLPMPAGWRASSFVRAAESAGILIRAADEYVLLGGRAPNAVRIAIDAQISCTAFKTAALKLAQLLREPPHNFDV